MMMVDTEPRVTVRAPWADKASDTCELVALCRRRSQVFRKRIKGPSGGKDGGSDGRYTRDPARRSARQSDDDDIESDPRGSNAVRSAEMGYSMKVGADAKARCASMACRFANHASTEIRRRPTSDPI